MLGRRARLKVGVMLTVRVPRGRREMIAPWCIETVQAAGREGCNIAKMGQLRQPRTGYCWNHSKNWIYNVHLSLVCKTTLNSWHVIKIKIKFHRVLSKWKGSLKRFPYEASKVFLFSPFSSSSVIVLLYQIFSLGICYRGSCARILDQTAPKWKMSKVNRYCYPPFSVLNDVSYALSTLNHKIKTRISDYRVCCFREIALRCIPSGLRSVLLLLCAKLQSRRSSYLCHRASPSR